MSRGDWVRFGAVVLLAVATYVLGVIWIDEASGQEVTTHEHDLPVPPVQLGDPPAGTPAWRAPRPDDDSDDPSDTPPPVFYGEEVRMEGDAIYYVLDASGSMGAEAGGPFVGVEGEVRAGSRWDQAVAECTRSIAGLADTFRFGVLVYDCAVMPWNGGLLADATADNKLAATAWLAAQRPRGSTGTGPAVAHALQRNRQCLAFVLLTDGAPNCGAPSAGPMTRAQRNYYATHGGRPTPEAEHRKMIRENNLQRAAINVFGIGAGGVQRDFCQGVAVDSGGTYVDVP